MNETPPEDGSASARSDDAVQRWAKLTIAIGIALLVLAVAVVLSRPATESVGGNLVSAQNVLGMTNGGLTICQGDEVVPRDTSRVALWLPTAPDGFGPAVSIAVIAHGRTVARGRTPADWSDSPVEIPVRPTFAADTPARICATLARKDQVALIGTAGARPPAMADGVSARGRLRFGYLRDDPPSRFATVPDVARRIGYGRGWTGPAAAVVVVALLAAAIGTAAWQLGRRQA